MKELTGQVASNIEALHTQRLVLRRCKECKRINRMQFERAMTARCGFCSGELNLSHYDVLGIVQTAAHEEIRKAFHSAVQQWHPDKRPQENSVSQQFQRIVAAYQILRDPADRRTYDLTEAARIHIRLRQEAADPALDNKVAREKFDSRKSGEQGAASTDNRPKNTSGTHIDGAKETVHLIATTFIMLLGVAVWALFQRSSGNPSPLLLWIALATGLYGVGKFLFVLSDR